MLGLTPFIMSRSLFELSEQNENTVVYFPLSSVTAPIATRTQQKYSCQVISVDVMRSFFTHLSRD